MTATGTFFLLHIREQTLCSSAAGPLHVTTASLTCIYIFCSESVFFRLLELVLLGDNEAVTKHLF